MLSMSRVVLKDLNNDYIEENIAESFDKNCLSFFDKEKNNIEICLFDEGICLFKQGKDYLLELHLLNTPYAKITSIEGIIKFDAKIVEFHRNNDNIVMHYLINDEDKVIEIIN